MLGNNVEKEDAKKLVENAISSGLALNKFKELVSYQGGNINCIENTKLFPKSEYNIELISEKKGYINSMDTEEIGKISCKLGAGREKKDDQIDYSAGITILKKTGDFIKTGETIALLHTNQKEKADDLIMDYLNSIKLTNSKPENHKLIYEVID